MKSLRPWKEVLWDWVPELAAKLNRPEAEILNQGLGASNFSPTRSVEVRFPFGLTHRLTFAFAVVRPPNQLPHLPVAPP
jgi:hypothetical protein